MGKEAAAYYPPRGGRMPRGVRHGNGARKGHKFRNFVHRFANGPSSLYTLTVMRCHILFLAALLSVAVPFAPGQTKPARAKNVILLLADAGGIPSLNAASFLEYKAPQRLHIQSWPNLGLSDTSPVGNYVSDSANGMTSIVTGQKTRNGVISQGPDVVRGKKDGTWTKTVLEYAEEHGLATGVVTTQSIADATPAACYAHANDRGKWGEIFVQAFKPRFGDGVDVVMGTGRKRIGEQLEQLGTSFEKLAQEHKRPIVSRLQDVAPGNMRPIVVGDEIDVRAAALEALSILQKSKKGYFLMVEWDVHTDNPKAGLEHIIGFDKLAREIESKVDLKDTLILFTADHSFGFQMDGGSLDEPLLAGYDEWSAGDRKGNIRLKNVYVNRKHTGEEVVALATGAGASQVKGYFPNTKLFHIMLNAWGFKP